MAYSDYNFASGSYATSYSGNYYGYQVGVIFAILIAGLLLLAICAAVIYFGCVKGMRHNDKQWRYDTSSTRTGGVRTGSYSQFSTEKVVPVEYSRASYKPERETPILQSSLLTQSAYVPKPPSYAPQPAYSQQLQQQPLERTHSRQLVIDNGHPRQVTIADPTYSSTQSRTCTRQNGASSTWKETVAERVSPDQRMQTSSILYHTSSV